MIASFLASYCAHKVQPAHTVQYHHQYLASKYKSHSSPARPDFYKAYSILNCCLLLTVIYCDSTIVTLLSGGNAHKTEMRQEG